MCQQKSLLLLPRSVNGKSYTPLRLPDRQQPVPDSSSSLKRTEYQMDIMEEGTFLPSNEMIPPAVIQQRPLKQLEGSQHNDYSSPTAWRSKTEQNNMQTSMKQDGHPLHELSNAHKQRPISDAGIELHNRWKHKNESGNGGLVNRSLPEQNLPVQVGVHM